MKHNGLLQSASKTLYAKTFSGSEETMHENYLYDGDNEIGAFSSDGKPEETGHKAHDHYHRLNPNKTGKQDMHIDAQGNPVPEHSEASHLYPPDGVWWEKN